MKLTFEQIKSIAFGAIKIVEEERGIRFYRCTEKQIEANSYNPTNYTVSSSGVRLDFHTNSETLTFSADMKPEWGSNYEVLVDDLMVGHYCLKDYRETNGTIVHKLGKGEKRVTLLFPILGFETWLRFVELDDGATLVPHKYTGKKFYFLGDSITQGYTAEYNFTIFPHALSRRFDIDFVSSGIGGLHFRSSIIDEIPYKPDYAMILIGTNNWHGSRGSQQTPESFKALIYEFMDRFAEVFPNTKTIVVSPIWRSNADEDRPIGSLKEVGATLKECADDHGFMFIDGFKLLPPHSELLDDGIHPNSKGFAVYSERLAAELERLIDLK